MRTNSAAGTKRKLPLGLGLGVLMNIASNASPSGQRSRRAINGARGGQSSSPRAELL